MLQFDKYHSKAPTAEPVAPISTQPSIDSSKRVGTYGYSYMRDAVKSSRDDATANKSPRQELDDYLLSGPVDVDDVVAWWGVSVL